MHRKTLWLVVPAFALGFALSWGLAPAALQELAGTRTIKPLWQERHATLGGLAAAADAIVVGEVVALERGRSVAEDPDLDFTEVTLRVQRAVKGEPGAEVTVEVVGDPRHPEKVVFADLPRFAAGGRYLLFLKRQEVAPYLYYVLNNQAGYTLERDHGGALFAAAADPSDEVAARLHNLKLSVALERIQASRGPEGRPAR